MAHAKLNTFHLFAGAGGGILGDLLLGHNPIGACEIEPYPRDVLLARQRDGILQSFPIWDDVATLDGNPWRGSVDVLCGGFPCQDISAAGKGAGISGERSGLWKEYARLIGEMRPRFVFAENSPLLRTRGLGVVLEDLAALGYNARWGIIGAGAIGAPHKRDRMWVLAYCRCEYGQKGDVASLDAPTEERSHGSTHDQSSGAGQDLAYTNRSGSDEDRSASELRTSGIEQSPKDSRITNETEGREVTGWWYTDPAELPDTDHQWNGRGEQQPTSRQEAKQSCGTGSEEDCATEPLVGRVAHGVANRVDRLKAIGNGQVPQCAAVAFNILSEGLT